ncbi:MULTISPECIES: hypothetical protein [Pantoea]|uniref:hypothetical protein n=1 Tax=Pantoea TaxID=53335 RepID=UPI0019130FC6|nr:MULTISPECIES: hypothetical protein [Pantoea]MBK5015917.1 hypothetical protein [Pantoea sp. S62]
MNKDKIVSANKSILETIDDARSERRQTERTGINILPKELRFLFKTTQFEINELITLCKDDYRKTIVVLITKVSPENVEGYSFIDKFRSSPFIFINLLALHPKSKVKVKGSFKYAAVKILRRNKTLFDLARKIYIKVRG